MIKKIFVGLFAVSSIHLNAEPTVSISEEPYKISGDTEASIRQSLNAARVQGTGMNFDAFTSWNITWDFDYLEDAGSCKVQKPRLQVKVVYKLPQLNTSTLPPSVASKWNSYLTALRQHEDGHRDLGIEAAKEIETALKNSPTLTSCDDLNQKANRIAEDILEKYRKKESDYDKNTQHGKTQGATFF